jgi:acetyl-CoA acetyltransferase
MSSSDVFITGAAESPLGLVPDHSELSMVATATLDALAEAGLGLADVDGVFVNYMGEEGSVQVAEYLGIQPRYADSSDLGGAAFEAFVHHAYLALQAGRCSVALIAYASRQRSRRSRVRQIVDPRHTPLDQFENPVGLPLALGQFALVAARHMYQFGTTAEQLAEVAVAARQWAMLNPQAWARDALTVEDVLNSPMICEPLHKLDCCLVTDGGGAIIMTTRDRAAGAARPPVRVLGAGESHSHWQISQMPDLTVSAGARSARDAFAMSGVRPSDIDVFEPYDAATITVLMALEDVGFCAKGEAGAFVAEGRLRPGGSLPAMTSGGGLSYCHPGALGLLLLIEAVRQLRGEAAGRQVPNAELAAVHGIGGLYSVASTVVLAHE